MATAHKSRVLDMTQGDPFRLVLQFSMPLFCSNLLQQLYNLTDTALAGHLLGSAALAEIGATAALSVSTGPGCLTLKRMTPMSIHFTQHRPSGAIFTPASLRKN